MKKILKLIILLVFLAGLSLTLSGCDIFKTLSEESLGTTIKESLDGALTKKDILERPENISYKGDLVEFTDINELRIFLEEQEIKTSSAPSVFEGPIFAREGDFMIAAAESAVAKAAPQPETIAAPGADDFSQTNVQVQGIDEPDFVKNDDKYIYIIADNSLVIVDAFNKENADIISKTQLPTIEKSRDKPNYLRDQARELFVNDDKLALFITSYEDYYYFNKYDIEPIMSSRPKTLIAIYDIKNRLKPSLNKLLEFSGSYFDSRMIDDVVYIISQESAGSGYTINEPFIRDISSNSIIHPKIGYFPENQENNYQFNTIASINLTDEKIIDTKTLMLGYTNSIYVSPENIYITYPKNRNRFWILPREDYEEDRKKRFYDIIVPLLEGDLEEDIKKIINSDASENEKWSSIVEVLNTFYQMRNEDELTFKQKYGDMLNNIAEKLEEYDTKREFENSKTVIHQININEGKLKHTAKGEVLGSLLNQFSLDEYENHLRVATTVNVWVKKRIQHNNVYVLDNLLNVVGEVTNIAPDESIFSTRFLGDRLYMVTFRQIDPFFVIDLKDPENPEILGKLKIPGFSNYLHPYDEDHIIGIGKEASTFGEDERVKIGGIKISMFDVSDVKNPEEIDKVKIGIQGSDSTILHDHKAFLLSLSKNLMVIPVTEVQEREQISEYRYSNSIWYGAYVFEVSKKGFKRLGGVEHDFVLNDYVQWFLPTTVRRSLYMDNILFTISNKYIKANDLDEQLEEVTTIRLPYTENRRYYLY